MHKKKSLSSAPHTMAIILYETTNPIHSHIAFTFDVNLKYAIRDEFTFFSIQIKR